MEQALRVLRLARDLPRGRGHPGSHAAALGRRYGISERTVYRDIALLQQAGLAVCNDGEGYYLLATDQSIPVELSSVQLASLLYAVSLVRKTVPAGLRDDLEIVLNQLTAACGSDEAIRSALDAQEGIDVSPAVTDGPRAVRAMATAIKARRLRKQVRGVYHSADSGRVTERVIHPYAIAYRGDAHYLVGYCEVRGEIRTFRLDRFLALDVLDLPANIPDDYDIAEQFAGAWRVTGGRRHKVRLRVCGVTNRRVRSAALHPSQVTVAQTPEETILELHVALTDELCTWILGLGADVEVQAPRSLRRRIADTAQKILHNYS